MLKLYVGRTHLALLVFFAFFAFSTSCTDKKQSDDENSVAGDITPPSAPSISGLGPVPISLTDSVVINWSPGSDESGGSGLAGTQFRIIKDSDLSEAQSWTDLSGDMAHNLNLENVTQYHIELRSMDVAGNASGVTISDSWTTSTGAGTWSPTSTVGAPTARTSQKALWTGSKMIVWGGSDPVTQSLNTGGLYDPDTDVWTSMSTIGAPTGGAGAVAVWTGTKMIAWGRSGNGALYDPSSNTWTPMSATGAPTVRSFPSVVWTGSRMIVWGGTIVNSYQNDGGVYNPTNNTWASLSATGAPTARNGHMAVWTGSKMLIVGGDEIHSGTVSGTTTAGTYDLSNDTWSPMTPNPEAPYIAQGVWTGVELLLWGTSTTSGSPADGWRYSPGSDSWTAIASTGFPAGRYVDTNYDGNIWPAVGQIQNQPIWTGTRMIVWGGNTGYNYTNTGGIYDGSSDTWVATQMSGAPSARIYHSVVSTGTKMIVWGGGNGSVLVNTGGIYSKPEVADITVGNESGSSVAYNGKVYFAGGYGGGAGVLDDVYIYDAISLTQSIHALSAPRGFLSGAVAGTKVLFAGGQNSTPTALATVDILETTSNAWSTQSVSQARYYMASASLGAKAYFGGGLVDSSTWVDRVDIYDSSNDTWATATLSAARYGIGAAATNGKVMFGGGGHEGGSTMYTSVVDILDVSSGTWSTSNLSQARMRLAAAALGNKVYFAGGYAGGSGRSALVDIYDTATSSWSTASLSEARDEPEAAIYGTKIFFSGGFTDSGTISNVIDIYDSATNKWSTMKMPRSRVRHKTAAAAGKVFFWGGYDYPSIYHPQMQVDILDLTTNCF